MATPEHFDDDFDVDKEMAEYCRDERRRERRMIARGLFQALWQRGKKASHPERRLWRWWYVVKLIVCILLRRTYCRESNYYKHVEPALLWCEDYGYGWNAESLIVGEGIRRNWWYAIATDGDSYL